MRSLALAVWMLSATSHAAPISWQWDPATPDLFPAVDITAGGSIRLAQSHGGLELTNGAWSTAVETEGIDADLRGAAMVVDRDRIYVATYNRIATGCMLAAFSIDKGARLWSVSLEGAGPISHSKYANRVQLREIDGKPVVFGAESAARYVEVRDPITGSLVSNVKLSGQWVERPVAEALYTELAGRLANSATSEISVDDFLARSVRMKDVDHAGRGAAFRQAVGSLQHVPFSHGRFELQLELVERHGDFVVTAKRVAVTK